MNKSVLGNSLPHCLVCGRDEELVPLIQIHYRGNAYWICPEHFPVLIHNPEQLIGKLPGAEHLTPRQHGHDE